MLRLFRARRTRQCDLCEGREGSVSFVRKLVAVGLIRLTLFSHMSCMPSAALFCVVRVVATVTSMGLNESRQTGQQDVREMHGRIKLSDR